MIFGLMTQGCKNKKDIYNRKGFYGIDAFSKYWSDGTAQDIKLTFKEGDEIKCMLYPEDRKIIFSKANSKMQ